MKAKIAIHGIRVEAEVESEDGYVQQRCQEIIDAAGERIEHAIAQAVCEELKAILPGITAQVTGIANEGDDDN